MRVKHRAAPLNAHAKVVYDTVKHNTCLNKIDNMAKIVLMPVRYKIASIVEHAIFYSTPFSLHYNIVTMPYFMCTLICYIYNISSGVSWSICAIIKMLYHRVQ